MRYSNNKLFCTQKVNAFAVLNIAVPVIIKMIERLYRVVIELIATVLFVYLNNYILANYTYEASHTNYTTHANAQCFAMLYNYTHNITFVPHIIVKTCNIFIIMSLNIALFAFGTKTGNT